MTATPTSSSQQQLEDDAVTWSSWERRRPIRCRSGSSLTGAPLNYSAPIPVFLKCSAQKRWGEPVYQFISCLLQHATDHYYSVADDESFLDVPYWVCTRECMCTHSHAHIHIREHGLCTCVCTCTRPHSFAGMCIRQQSACTGG